MPAKEERIMTIQWISTELYEHPAEHRAGEFGKVELSHRGVYKFRQGNVLMSCPQGWAAKIHHDELAIDRISERAAQREA